MKTSWTMPAAIIIIVLATALYLAQDYHKPVSESSLSDEIIIASVRELVKVEDPEIISLDQSRPMKITEKVDFTGDGNTEYIIDLGTGGAATDMYTIARVENNEVILIRFKAKENQVYWWPLLSGSGGAGRYSYEFALQPQNQRIVMQYFSVYGTQNDFCVGEIYRWNEASKLFEYDIGPSVELQKQVDIACKAIAI